MTWRVLISAPYMRAVLDEYQHVFAANDIQLVIPSVRERLTEEELLQWIVDVDGVICGDDQFTAGLLAAASRLKVISKWGTGIDSIDCAAAAKCGVRVYNTPDAFTDAVADTVIGYMLCFARQLPWMDRDMRSGTWLKRSCVALRECSIGVIGVGNIGKAVIRRAMAFGMTLFGNDVLNISPEFVKETGVRMASKDDLLDQADFVSLNCDLNPTSFHLIGETDLKLMKPAAYLINTARGPVVDEAALVAALQSRLIAGAALDVFELEPLPEDSPLRNLENVLLAPHNANSSREAWRRVHQDTIRNLLEGLRGGG